MNGKRVTSKQGVVVSQLGERQWPGLRGGRFRSYYEGKMARVC